MLGQQCSMSHKPEKRLRVAIPEVSLFTADTGVQKPPNGEKQHAHNELSLNSGNSTKEPKAR